MSKKTSFGFFVLLVSMHRVCGLERTRDETPPSSSAETKNWFKISRIILNECFDVIYANLKRVTQLASATLGSDALTTIVADPFFIEKQQKSRFHCFPMAWDRNWIGGFDGGGEEKNSNANESFKRSCIRKKAQTHDDNILANNNNITQLQPSPPLHSSSRYHVAEEQQ